MSTFAKHCVKGYKEYILRRLRRLMSWRGKAVGDTHGKVKRTILRNLDSYPDRDKKSLMRLIR